MTPVRPTPGRGAGSVGGERYSCSVEALVWVNVSETITHVNGDHAQYLDHTFRCTYLDGEPYVADDESLEVRWFPIDRLPPMAPSFVERIMTAVEHDGPTRLS